MSPRLWVKSTGGVWPAISGETMRPATAYGAGRQLKGQEDGAEAPGGGMTDYLRARAVACPRCAAKPGNSCVNAYGSQMRLLHPCRWRAVAEREGQSIP